jgi:uncharacterized protein
MNYIIDGHNLIAHIPGLSLEMLDDEEQLIQLLNQYGEKQRGKLEVYFDGAPIGQAGERSFGRVRAYFVPQINTADEAIRVRLVRLGRSARDWKVVSSDRSVQAAAREVLAGVLKAEDFASQLLQALKGKQDDSENNIDQPLSPAEVDEWLAFFKQRKPTK